MAELTFAWVDDLQFPDLTPLNGDNLGDRCANTRLLPLGHDLRYPSVVFCTRHKNHGGRHAAGDGEHVLAVWR
jgi:hypothetical protein